MKDLENARFVEFLTLLNGEYYEDEFNEPTNFINNIILYLNHFPHFATQEKVGVYKETIFELLEQNLAITQEQKIEARNILLNYININNK